MSAILELDLRSQLARLDPAAALGSIEAELRPHGLSLGPLAVESQARSLGQALAAPRPSEATPRGRLQDRCAALDAILIDGTAVSTRLAPRKATGPDFAAALIGAHGTTGRITGAWMRLSRRPERRQCLAFAFAGADDDAGGQALERALRLLGQGLLPTDLAVVDEELAAGGAAEAARAAGAAVLVVARFDGAAEVVAAEVAVAGALLAEGAGGGRALAAEVAERFLLERQPLRLAEVSLPAARLAGCWARRRSPTLLCGLLPDRPAWCGDPSALPSPAATDPGVDALHARLRAALLDHAQA